MSTILILEVEVNGAASRPGQPQCRQPRMEESLLGDDFNGRVKTRWCLSERLRPFRAWLWLRISQAKYLTLPGLRE